MNWLMTEIMTGLQKLLVLSLDRTPAAEVIPGTAQTWLEALMHNRSWDMDRDRERIRDAFATLLQTQRQWPVVADLIAALPRVDEKLLALPAEANDPAKALIHIAECKRLLGETTISTERVPVESLGRADRERIERELAEKRVPVNASPLDDIEDSRARTFGDEEELP